MFMASHSEFRRLHVAVEIKQSMRQNPEGAPDETLSRLALAEPGR
jgi:hypothetical protein